MAAFLSRAAIAEGSTQKVVDLMVILVKVKPGVLIQISGREQARRFAARILADELPGASLSPSSKLSIRQVSESVSVGDARKQLTETMRAEMGKAGLDPGAYNMRTIVAMDSGNTYLCRAAIRREP